MEARANFPRATPRNSVKSRRQDACLQSDSFQNSKRHISLAAYTILGEAIVPIDATAHEVRSKM
jgi:hypothetical protein